MAPQPRGSRYSPCPSTRARTDCRSVYISPRGSAARRRSCVSRRPWRKRCHGSTGVRRYTSPISPPECQLRIPACLTVILATRDRTCAGNDVTVRAGPELVDHLAAVGQAGAEDMDQKRLRRVAGHRHGCRFGAVSFVPMRENGGRTPDRRPAHGRHSPLHGEGRVGNEPEIDPSDR